MNPTSSDAPSSPASLLRLGGPKAVQFQMTFRALMLTPSGENALELRGTLSFVVGPMGTIGAGELVEEIRGHAPVLGKVFGRDVAFLCTFPDGSKLVAEGTAQEDAGNWFGAILGVTTFWHPDGSQPYRPGSWNATRILPVNP